MIDQITTYLQHQTSQDLFSGSILIAQNHQPILEYASGLANHTTSIPNTIHTKFNLGSINKLFTTLAIAQLAEQNKLSFTDLIGKYLPHYPNQTVCEQITIHHLLTHISGLGSFIDLKYRQEFLQARPHLKSIQDIINLFQNKPFETPIGTFHYSSNGFELLGRIIEVITEQNYYDYIRQHLYQPANMPNTDCYHFDPTNPPQDIAIGYTNRDPHTDQILPGDKFDNFGLNLYQGTAAGSGYSTCHDLLNFAISIQNYTLLGEKMTNQILKPQLNLGSKGNKTKYQAYGFQIFKIGEITRIGHPGRFSGINTRFDIYPELGYIVIVLSNYDPPAAFDMTEHIGEIIINQETK